LDKETPEKFHNYHYDDDPSPEHEDCYGQRGPCLYNALDLRSCYNCKRLVCSYCYEGCERGGCENVLCENCVGGFRDTCCHRCGSTVEDNDQLDIGPVTLDKVCKPCFESESPQKCGCGEKSRWKNYYKMRDEDDEDDDEDDEDEYEDDFNFIPWGYNF